MIVEKYMQKNPPVVQGGTSFRDVVEILCEQRAHSVLVVNEEKTMEGIVSRNRAFKLLSKQIPMQTPVEDIMEKNVIFIKPETPISKLIEWSVSSLPVVENKKVVGVVALTDTINAYNAAMLSLQQELEATINSVYNAIVGIDNQGYIRTFNDAAKQLFQVEIDSFSTVKIEEIFGKTYLREVLRTGEAMVNKKIKYREKTLLFTGTIIVDKGGEINGAVGVFNDYTELVNIYGKMFKERERKEELTAIFEASFDGLIVTDIEGNIREVNNAFLKYIGQENEEIVGKSVNCIKDENLRRIFEKLIHNHNPETMGCGLRNGMKLLISSSPMINQKRERLGMVANVKNVTEIEELEKQLDSINKLYHEQVVKKEIFAKYVFEAPTSKKLIDRVMKVAAADSTVLITGESGVGKEIIANLIYQNSERASKMFAKINCAAIPESLLESELFGYEEGAFTGANKKGKQGLFESANKGVILLDEIGELPLEVQAKLLRVLQEGEFFRVGGTTPITVDVRILSATNQDLENLVYLGKFRRDLYYRLNVVPIDVPPLRQRREDLIGLISINLHRFNEKHKKTKKLSVSALELLQTYEWPGNVRELENVIERAIVFSENDIIGYNEINVNVGKKFQGGVQATIDESKSFKEMVADYERLLLREALEKYKTTRAVGEKLRLDQSTIVKKMQKLEINRH